MKRSRVVILLVLIVALVALLTTYRRSSSSSSLSSLSSSPVSDGKQPDVTSAVIPSTPAAAAGAFTVKQQIRTHGNSGCETASSGFWNNRLDLCESFDDRSNAQVTDLEREELLCSDHMKSSHAHRIGSRSSSTASDWITTSESLLPVTESIPEPARSFMRATSFLFRSWKPWHPIPSSTHENKNNNDKHKNNAQVQPDHHRYEFRSVYNRSNEFLYEIENFCVSPFGGRLRHLSLSTTQRTFLFKDDSRGALGHTHQDLFYNRFFQTVERKPTSASSSAAAANGMSPQLVFDRRPVIFFSIGRQVRHNTAHVTHRVLSLLGVIRIVRAAASDGIEPLLVLVDEGVRGSALQLSEKTNNGRDGDTFVSRKVPVIGFFLAALNLPFAVVLAPHDLGDEHEASTAGDSAGSSVPEYVAAMAKITKHPVFSAPQHTLRDAALRSEMCFLRGVVHSSCYDCYPDSRDEEESYAFGLWQNPKQLDKRHYSLVNELRSRLLGCVSMGGGSRHLESAVAAAVTSSSSLSSSAGRLPRIFFDIRTMSASRRVRSLSLFALQDIVEPLKPYSSSIVFREQWRSGSRRDYLADVASSDIFVSLFHGGAIANTALMREDSYLIEFTTPHFYPATKLRGVGADEKPFLWFGALTSARFFRAHWVLELERDGSPGQRQSYFLPPQLIVQVVRDAACEWIFAATKQHHNKSLLCSAPSSFGSGPRVESADGKEATLFRRFDVSDKAKAHVAAVVQMLLSRRGDTLHDKQYSKRSRNDNRSSVSRVAHRVASELSPFLNAPDDVISRFRFLVPSGKFLAIWSLIVATVVDAKVSLDQEIASAFNCSPSHAAIRSNYRVRACLNTSTSDEEKCKLLFASEPVRTLTESDASCSSVVCHSCLLTRYSKVRRSKRE